MKPAIFWPMFLTLCLVGILGSCSNPKAQEFPDFEFDIWGGSPPRVRELTEEKPTQQILFSIKERPLSSKKIAALTNVEETSINAILEELESFDVVKKTDDGWLSNIPLYVKEEIQEGEKIGLKYAEKEAAILRNEIPRLKEVYARTETSRFFPWDDISLIIVGGFLSDFCVVDRVPFKPENFTEELQPPLGKEGQKKWGYEGYEVLPWRFPSRKWKFYQNVTSRFSGGGARFGYFRNPDEQRKTPPSRPEGIFSGATGKILFALAEGPLDHQELLKRSRLGTESFEKALDTLLTLDPPAVVLKEGRYGSKIPVLPKSDFERLLPELDRVAADIFQQVVLKHTTERKEMARTLGYRWPLPADTYIRDKALQILVEEGLLSQVQDPPVDWSFHVWGWQGFLAMHNEIVANIQPPDADPFIDSAMSDDEKGAIEYFRSVKKNILKGEKFLDVSCPVRAFLTRISGWCNRDLDALKAVEIPGDDIQEVLANPENSSRVANFLSQTEISRVRFPDREPEDGDLVPIFTTDGEGTHVFFYYRGEWKFLGQTAESEEYWRAHRDGLLKEKMAYLGLKQKEN